MPDPFQPVAACTDNQRGFLASFGTVLKRCKVITDYLQTVKQVIKILDFGDRPKAPHSKPDSLSDDRCFPDTGISDPEVTIFGLQSFQCLVNASDISYIFAEDQCIRVCGKNRVKVGLQYFPSGNHAGILTKFGGDSFHIQCAF